MSKPFQRLAFLLIPFVFSFFLIGFVWADSKEKKEDLELTILYTTDLSGQFRDFRCKRPGVKNDNFTPAKRDMANLLALVDQVRKEVVQKRGQVPPYLFNTGDNLGSSLPVRFLLEFEGLAGVDFIARMFKRFGYNLIGLGNHEFTPGPDKLAAFLSQSFIKGLRFIASNLEIPTNAKELAQFNQHAISKYVNDVTNKKPYFVFEPEKGGIKTGVKIGVFHLVPGEMQKKVSGKTVRGIKFTDPSSVVSDIVTKLRETEKADIIIMLSHLEGSNTNGKVIRELIGSTEGIDLVITNEFRFKGKAQAISTFDKTGKGVYIVGGTYMGTQLGKVVLKVHKASGQKAKIVSFEPSALALSNELFDSELRRELIKWEASYCKRWGSPLGKGRIRDGFAMTQKQFGEYLLNLVRFYTKTEVAFINKRAMRNVKVTTSDGTTITKPFPIKGYVTKDDLFRALPFDQGFQIIRLKGSQLSSLMDGFAGDDKGEKEIYFAGVKDGKINGREIQSERWYSAITIDYIANGKMGGLEIKKSNKSLFLHKTKERVLLRNLIFSHFERNQFETLPAAPAPKKEGDDLFSTNNNKKIAVPPKPFARSEIPFTGLFYSLSNKWAWKLKTRLNLGGTATFNSPVNINTFQFDGFEGDNNFEKFQFNSTMNMTFEADSGPHFVKMAVDIAYNLFTSRQWVQDPAPGFDKRAFFREDGDDMFKITAEYTWKTNSTQSKWYVPNPSFEYSLETELTRGKRPDITGDGLFVNNNTETDLLDYFRQTGETQILRKFITQLKGGLKWLLGKEKNLILKLSLSWVRRFGIQNCIKLPESTTPNAKKVWCEGNTLVDAKGATVAPPKGSFDLSNRLALTLEYDHDSVQIGKIGDRAISWTVDFDYEVKFSFGQEYRDTHKLIMDNKLSFQIQGNLSLALGLRFALFHDFFRPTDQGTLLRGPVGVALIPRISLEFNWGTRGQSF